MKRTTSMKEIDLDLSSSSVEMPLHSHNMKDLRNHQKATSETPLRRHPKVSDPRFISSAVSPRNHTRNSAVFMETASFLRACGLCNRRLGPGRDIYMYRYLSQRLCFWALDFNCLYSFVFLWSGNFFSFLLSLLLLSLDDGFSFFLSFFMFLLIHLIWWFFDFSSFIFVEENDMKTWLIWS